MVDYLEITPSGQRPSRLELHLERDTLTRDDCLVGRVILIGGNDGLRLASLRVAPQPSGATNPDTSGPFQAYWEAVRVAPRKREWLDFRLQIPQGCAGARGQLLVEAITNTAELAVLRVPLRVGPPGVYVKIGEWIARRTGLVVHRVWQGEGETCLLLEAPAGHESLDRIELGFADHHRYGIRVGVSVAPRRRGVERLRWLVRYQPGTTFELEVDPERLDDALPALDAALRPFLAATRDLPLPTSAPPGMASSQLPIASDPSHSDGRSLPRPAPPDRGPSE